MKFDGPDGRVFERRGHVYLAKIARRNDEPDVVEAGARGQNEEFFDSGVAESEAADGRRTAVNHDVAAEGRKIASVLAGALHVIGVGVVYA